MGLRPGAGPWTEADRRRPSSTGSQIQAIASLYYPGGPNDVAPGVYTYLAFEGTLPGSALPAPAGEAGFGRK